MINALSPTLIVRGLTLFIMVVVAGVLLMDSRDAAYGLLKVQGTVVGVINAFVFVLTLRPVFLWLHRCTRADLWWFPLLDGEWTGELRSNWPRINAMMVAARGAGPRFDALTDELPEAAAELTVLDVTISCSLFAIEMVIRIPGRDRQSRTFFVRPQWCRPHPPQISYVYEQTDHGRLAVTDGARHRGAAVLEYDVASGELRGEYWTNRESAKGLNTAGVLILRRTPGA